MKTGNINFISEENNAELTWFSSQTKGCLAKNVLGKDKKVSK